MRSTTERALFIVKNLLRVSSGLHRNGDRIAGQYGLNQQQFVVLSEIVDRGPINQKQLVGELVIEKSNLSKIVKKLRTLRLIRISSSPEDGRTTFLVATREGKTVWHKCMEQFSNWQVQWIAPLEEEQVDETIEVLERLKALPLETKN